MNCKPGDLAYIVNTVEPRNVGKVVEVLEYAGVNPYFDDWIWCGGQGPSWFVRCESGLIGSVDGISRKVAVCADSRLRPISGVPVHDEVTEEITA
jgi:hypothetical protein